MAFQNVGIDNGRLVVGSGGGGGGMRLIWEWNETDLSQFDVVGGAGFSVSVTTWNARWAGWVDETPAIQIDNPASTDFLGLLIKQSELDLSLYKNVIVTYRSSANGAAGTQRLLYIPYYEDNTHLLGIQNRGNLHQMCLLNGSAFWSEGNNLGARAFSGNAGDSMRIGTRYRQFATNAIKPIITLRNDVWAPNYSSGLLEPQTEQWLFQSSYAASWLTRPSYQPRIGFGCRALGTAASPGETFADLQLWSYDT